MISYKNGDNKAKSFGSYKQLIVFKKKMNKNLVEIVLLIVV